MSVKKCIYCLKTEPQVTFNKAEHILIQSFGKFENNIVLNRGVYGVCDSCNQFFGNTIDRVLARDTFEGIIRFKENITESKKYKSEGQRSLLRIKGVEGFFEGSLVYPRYDEENDEVRMFLLPDQIGIKRIDNGKYDFFSIEELPDIKDIPKTYYDENGKVEFFYDFYDESIMTKIKEKGYRIERDYPIQELDLFDSKNILFEFERKIDDTIGRAVSKIAFNYLCYDLGVNYVCSETFNNIRNFIYKAEGNVEDFVQIEDMKLLKIEKELNISLLGHLVGYEFVGDKIYGVISLFNTIKYRVLLCNKFGTLPSTSSKGHFFDTKNMLTKEISKKDSREIPKMFNLYL